jgi:hypothetical protein
VVSLNTASRTRYDLYRGGAQILQAGTYTNTYGEEREALSVNFSTDRINSLYQLPEGFAYDPEVFTLPNMRGYGQVPDLWVAMSLDPVLKQMVQDYIADLPENASEMVGGTLQIYGIAGVSDPYFIYQETEFEHVLMRWAGVEVVSGFFSEFAMQDMLETFLAEPFRPGTRLTGSNFDGVDDPRYFDPYRQFTTNMATRFLTQVADIAENRPAMDLFLALQTASAGGTELTQAQIDVLVDQAMTAAENQPPLPALLEHYSLLDFDFSAEAITGDVAAFIDGELQSLPLDPNDPWAGYGAWRPQVRGAVMPRIRPAPSCID